MSSGHTHNRNGRGNQRRKHGPPRQQPQNGQSQNVQPRNDQQPRGQNNSSTRSTPARSMTALPTRPEAPFQAPDARSLGGDGQFIVAESVTAEIREVTLDVEVETPAVPERPAPVPPRPAQQRSTQPPSKRGPFLVSSERQSVADSSQQTMQASSTSHVQPDSTELSAPPNPPHFRRGEHDAPPPPAYGMPYGGAGDTEDEDAEVVAHERRPSRDVRGDVGTLIDSLHDLFAQDRTIASQGNATRCGICYLHYPLSELEYRAVEGYYICADCKRALGSAQLMMVRRQQRN